jgi:drug/metabolite transporter (DMT)-like permease
MPALFVLIWSTGYVVARYGMPHAPPFSFLAVRFMLSILCFGAWIAFVRPAWPRGRTQWLHLCVVGVLMQAGYLGGVWAAVKAGMGAALVALIVNLQPVLTAIWVSATAASGDNKVSARAWGGLLLGFGGVVLVVVGRWQSGASSLEATPLSIALAVVALLAMTSGALYQKRYVLPCDVRTASTVQLTAALVVMAPLALLEGEPMVWNQQLLGAMAWSVLVLTLGGSSLLYLLIQRGAATAVTSLLYLVPPTTAMLAWALFAEAVTAWTIAGMALTAWGVYWVMQPQAPRPSASKAPT